MNRDHQEFAVLRDKLLRALSVDSSNDSVDRLLDELLEHSRDHFAAEERLMLDYRFPVFAIHKAEHDRVLTDMSARIQRWNREHNAKALHAWIDFEVGDWFVAHVSSMDLVTAEFIDHAQRRTEFGPK